VRYRSGDDRCRRVDWRAIRLLVSIALALALLRQDVYSQPSGPSQVDVEAVYLFNFAKFVRWPAGHDGEPLIICIAGEKAHVESATRVVAGERIGTHPLAVRSVQHSEEVTDCNILFVGTSAKSRLEGLLNAAAREPMLTVSDLPGFLELGGMINLLVLNNRVRFAVNMGAVEKSGLSLSSELLKVAVNVQGKESGETIR
jgi:uncharacterized protein DUF4154